MGRNLDCTLCHLRESAEAVRDFPLEEIFRRIDIIAGHYGPGTDVQVSGGEPTLRAEFVNDQGELDFPALAAKRRDLDAYVSFVADAHAFFSRRFRAPARTGNSRLFR